MTDEARTEVVKALRRMEDYALQEANLCDSPNRYWAIKGIAQSIHAYADQIERGE